VHTGVTEVVAGFGGVDLEELRKHGEEWPFYLYPPEEKSDLLKRVPLRELIGAIIRRLFRTPAEKK
jgi:hypothetical protein